MNQSIKTASPHQVMLRSLGVEILDFNPFIPDINAPTLQIKHAFLPYQFFLPDSGDC